jgi:hypothetical protein
MVNHHVKVGMQKQLNARDINLEFLVAIRTNLHMNDNNGLCQILVSANAFLEVVEARHAVALAQIAEQEQLLVCPVSEEAVHLFYHYIVVVLSVQVVVY